MSGRQKQGISNWRGKGRLVLRRVRRYFGAGGVDPGAGTDVGGCLWITLGGRRKELLGNKN